MTFSTYRAAGRCGLCGGAMLPEWPGSYCPTCKEERAERRRTAWRAKERGRAAGRIAARIDAGICIACPSLAAAGHVRCDACMARAKLNDAARLDAREARAA